MEVLCKNLYGPFIGDICWDDCNDLRSCDTSAIFFSPFAIPRAVELGMRYHHRPRDQIVEFNFVLEYNTHLLEKEGANPKTVELCSNCYVDPPSTGNFEIDYECWVPIEKINGKQPNKKKQNKF